MRQNKSPTGKAATFFSASGLMERACWASAAADSSKGTSIRATTTRTITRFISDLRVLGKRKRRTNPAMSD